MMQLLMLGAGMGGLLLLVAKDRGEVALAFVFSGAAYTILGPFYGVSARVNLAYVGALIIALQFLVEVSFQRRRLVMAPVVSLQAVMFVGLLLGFFWLTPSDYQVRQYLLFMATAALPLLYFSVLPHDPKRLTRFIIAFAVITVGLSLSLYPSHFRDAAQTLALDQETFRRSGTTLVRNNIAMGRFVGAGVILLVAGMFFLLERTAYRLASLVVLVPLLLMLVVVNQRGPLYGLAVVIVPWVFLRRWILPRRPSRWFLSSALIVAAIVMGLQSALDSYFTRLGAGLSSLGRVRIFARAIEIFVAHPVFGGGMGFAERSMDSMSTHNILLQLATDGGMVALSGFLLSVALLALRVRRLFRRPLTRGVRVTVVAGLTLFAYSSLQGLVSGDLVANAPIWLWMGYLLALERATRGARRGAEGVGTGPVLENAQVSR